MFAVINFALSRVFRTKDPLGRESWASKVTAGVVAFMLYAIATYGIYKMGFDFEDLFFNMGLSEETLYIIVPLVILAGLIYIGWKFGLCKVLVTLGIITIGVSMTDLVYEKGVALFAGLVILALGLFFCWRGRQNRNCDLPPTADRQELPPYIPPRAPPRAPPQQPRSPAPLPPYVPPTPPQTPPRQPTPPTPQQPQGTTSIPPQQPRRTAPTRSPPKQRREANFYISFRNNDTLTFNPGENVKIIRLGNTGGGEIAWDAHAFPTSLLKISPRAGVFQAGQIIDARLILNRNAVSAKGAKGLIGIHTRDRKRNKATFSARIRILGDGRQQAEEDRAYAQQQKELFERNQKEQKLLEWRQQQQKQLEYKQKEQKLLAERAESIEQKKRQIAQRLKEIEEGFTQLNDEYNQVQAKLSFIVDPKDFSKKEKLIKEQDKLLNKMGELGDIRLRLKEELNNLR